jgi:hypothetical protein
MGCDYYLIKQLEIIFTYKNIEYKTIYVLSRESKYYLEFDIDSVDSDSEDYYEYLHIRWFKERKKYNKNIIIYENNQYKNEICHRKYTDYIMESILKEINDLDLNLDNVIINEIRKVQLTVDR